MFLRRPRGIGEFSADAVRVLGVVSVIAAAIWWSVTDTGILAFTLPGLLVPRFIGVRPSFDIFYSVTALIAAWSNVLGLYTSIGWWDLAMHFLATGSIAAMLYLLLARWGIVRALSGVGFTRREPLVIVPMLALALSALWEMVEWLGYTFVSDEIFVAYTDTIGDMAIGGLGGLAAGLIVARVRLQRHEP
ncbi:hypothetical protein [Microbacterium sp.]|uniref:hypothetical protein n=1 Tax=Microbacterium sp. TaxID=51671 RepID=UPI003F944892